MGQDRLTEGGRSIVWKAVMDSLNAHRRQGMVFKTKLFLKFERWGVGVEDLWEPGMPDKPGIPEETIQAFVADIAADVCKRVEEALDRIDPRPGPNQEIICQSCGQEFVTTVGGACPSCGHKWDGTTPATKDLSAADRAKRAWGEVQIGGPGDVVEPPAITDAIERWKADPEPSMDETWTEAERISWTEAERISWEAVERLEGSGHTPHCARRMIWGDGECECQLPKAKASAITCTCHLMDPGKLCAVCLEDMNRQLQETYQPAFPDTQSRIDELRGALEAGARLAEEEPLPVMDDPMGPVSQAPRHGTRPGRPPRSYKEMARDEREAAERDARVLHELWGSAGPKGPRAGGGAAPEDDPQSAEERGLDAGLEDRGQPGPDDPVGD